MTNKIKEMLTTFVQSYLATAKWVTCDANEGNHGFTKKAKEIAFNDCKIFVDKVFAEFEISEAEAILNKFGIELSHLAAHDFFLTRNGHGSGFWDSPIYDRLAPNGCERLTKISKDCGSVDVWVNRGYIHF